MVCQSHSDSSALSEDVEKVMHEDEPRAAIRFVSFGIYYRYGVRVIMALDNDRAVLSVSVCSKTFNIKF